MPGGPWNPSSLPVRSGTYINFIAAVIAAAQPGGGTVAVAGRADWGPPNSVSPQGFTTQGDLDNSYGGSAWGGELRDAALQAMSGFDNGGAGTIYTYRIVGSTGAQATLTLDDNSAVAALTLTALYPGIRPNEWDVTVETNAFNPSNEDLILYENGVQIAQFLNVAGGTNTAFAAAINASGSALITAAATGAADRELAPIIAGAMGSTFADGDSGDTLTVNDYAAAQVALGNYLFDAVALANVTDPATIDLFAAWVESYNADSGFRMFGVLGGTEGEALATALNRSYSPSDAISTTFTATVSSTSPVLTAVSSFVGLEPGQSLTNVTYLSAGSVIDSLDPEAMTITMNQDGMAAHTAASIVASGPTGNYDNCDIVNVGATDLEQLSTGDVFSTAYLAPRVAGSIAGAGLTRAITGMTWTGYRVNNPLSNTAYGNAVSGGVVCFRQDNPTTISVEEGVTSQVTVDQDTNPAAHQQIANVAIDHFITLNLTQQGNAARGILRQSGAGRLNFLGNVQAFLKKLEGIGALESGSTVEYDSSYPTSGSQLFLRVGITYAEFVNQFFFSIGVA